MSDYSGSLVFFSLITHIDFTSLLIFDDLVDDLSKEDFRVEYGADVSFTRIAKEGVDDLAEQVKVLSARVLCNQAKVSTQELHCVLSLSDRLERSLEADSHPFNRAEKKPRKQEIVSIANLPLVVPAESFEFLKKVFLIIYAGRPDAHSIVNNILFFNRLGSITRQDLRYDLY